MIQGTRVEPRTVKRLFKVGDEIREREEQHLFMVECGYGRHPHQPFDVKPPGGACRRLTAAHSVTEHDDGTITVVGPPFVTAVGTFRLEAGNWIEIGDAQTSAPIAAVTEEPARRRRN